MYLKRCIMLDTGGRMKYSNYFTGTNHMNCPSFGSQARGQVDDILELKFCSSVNSVTSTESLH